MFLAACGKGRTRVGRALPGSGDGDGMLLRL